MNLLQFKIVGTRLIYPPVQSKDVMESAQFKCISNQEVGWADNTGNLPPNAEFITRNKSLKNVLRFNNVIKENEGNYYCKGNNGSTVFEATGKLMVKGV